MATPPRKRDALAYHREPRPGKIEVRPTKPCLTSRDLSLAYTPGVAHPCLDIEAEPDAAYEYTNKANLVAVITNGTAVLGLGDIGPLAGKPVMEGKAVLFKRFADIDVFDLEVDEADPERFVAIVKALAPTFGGINLEDIKAPEAFEIERRLCAELDIPVMHDDQHGTAIIAGAAFLNALAVAKKAADGVRIVSVGAGAAGIATMDLLLQLGVRREQIMLVDSGGVIHTGRADLSPEKARFAQDTPLRTLAEAMAGADVFIGLSRGGLVTPEMLLSMADRPIVFALANPDPEIDYPLARATRDDIIMATGRSDYPNQVNNVLGFPFIFRGALDVRARTVNDAMKCAAARALADLAREEVTDQVLAAYDDAAFRFGPDYIIPKPFDERVLYTVAPAVALAASESGVARRPITDIERYRDELRERFRPSGAVMRRVFRKARANPPRIVFTEGTSRRVLRACEVIASEGIARPMVIGSVDRIRQRAAAAEVDLEAAGIEVVDPIAVERFDEMVDVLFERRGRKGVTRSYAKRKLRASADYLAAMMVEIGLCDGMVSGKARAYPEALSPILETIGPVGGDEAVCGAYLVFKGTDVFLFADTAVHVDPDASELARIARTVAAFARKLDLTPRVAMLSYSNFGSARHPQSRKVAAAVEAVRTAEPSLMIDGEMQVEVALDPTLRARSFPFSHLGGVPNILVFPDLNSGHIAHQLMHRMGEAEAIGPILLGLRRPANVLQRESDVSSIVNLTALTALRAVTSSRRAAAAADE